MLSSAEASHGRGPAPDIPPGSPNLCGVTLSPGPAGLPSHPPPQWLLADLGPRNSTFGGQHHVVTTQVSTHTQTLSWTAAGGPSRRCGQHPLLPACTLLPSTTPLAISSTSSHGRAENSHGISPPTLQCAKLLRKVENNPELTTAAEGGMRSPCRSPPSQRTPWS